MVVLKHSMSDAKDCPLKWHADFAKMEMQLYVPFISPSLLLDFLMTLPISDERFKKTAIMTALQISNRFNIQLCVTHEDGEAWYGSAKISYYFILLRQIRYGDINWFSFVLFMNAKI